MPLPRPCPAVEGALSTRIYLYCVVRGAQHVSDSLDPPTTGTIGLVRQGQLAAVIGPAPDRLCDEEEALSWAQWHANTVEGVRQVHADVLPLRLGTVFAASSWADAIQKVMQWLELDAVRLHCILDRVQGSDEYGMQIHYSPRILADSLMANDRELLEAQSEAMAADGGQAYLKRVRFKRLLSTRLQVEVRRLQHEILQALRDVAVGVKVDPLPAGEGADSVSLLRLSCLVARAEAGAFLSALERLPRSPDMTVRLTGPWPPYSFVTG